MSTNLDRMTSKGRRRNRPETMLRLLISTSYPQTALSEIALAVMAHSGPTDPTDMSGLADELAEVERAFGMNDFIRSIEIIRTNETVAIVVKQLDFDPEARSIVDNNKTHVELARCAIHLQDPKAQLQELDALATRLVNIFRCIQPDRKKAGNPWTLRERPTPKGNAKLGNTAIAAVNTQVDQNMVVALLATSLRKNRFHIVLSNNAIMMFDQQRTVR
jgi:hypothetical protein